MGVQDHLIGTQCHAELISDAMQKMTLFSTCNRHLPYELIKALGVELSPYRTYAYRPCLHASIYHDWPCLMWSACWNTLFILSGQVSWHAKIAKTMVLHMLLSFAARAGSLNLVS